MRLGWLSAGTVLAAGLAAGPESLAVRGSDGWHTWWQQESAPAQWSAALPAVADRIDWRQAGPGVEWGELSLAGEAELSRVRVIVARLDPALLEFRLVKPANGPVFGGRWDIGEAPDEAVFAVNAGQFTDQPWGWLVEEGRERQPPGTGPLAPGVVVDWSGSVRLVPPDSLPVAGAGARLAFQSYPTLLEGDGLVPLPLRREGLGVDLTHRDARLAFGVMRDGRLLFVMTRFEAPGGILANLPVGLTTPEMAAVMGALGAGTAVLLDGGISCQLLIRDASETHQWPGWRRVALGLVAVPRARARELQ
jgi:hypothetical protein